MYVTPFPIEENIVIPKPVHCVEFDEYAIVFVPEPTATHVELPHATPLPLVLNIVAPKPVHIVAFIEYPIVFVPEPTATHVDIPLFATELPCVEKIEDDILTQLVKFVEYAMVFVPEPTLTYKDELCPLAKTVLIFDVTLLPTNANILVPKPVQVDPLVE